MFITLRQAAAVCAIFVTVAGCAPIAAPSSTAAPPSDQEAYYVIGVSPTSTRLGLFEGKVKDGKFDAGIKWNSNWYAPDDDGFLVAKVRGGATMGVLELVISESRDAVIGSTYVAGNKTLVFDAPAGKVVYITSVSYSRGKSDTVYNSTLEPDYHSDIAAARNFMQKHYPALADRLEQGSFRLMPGS